MVTSEGGCYGSVHQALPARGCRSVGVRGSRHAQPAARADSSAARGSLCARNQIHERRPRADAGRGILKAERPLTTESEKKRKRGRKIRPGNPEHSKDFIEAARKLGVGDRLEEFERAMRAVSKPKGKIPAGGN